MSTRLLSYIAISYYSSIQIPVTMPTIYSRLPNPYQYHTTLKDCIVFDAVHVHGYRFHGLE